MKGGSLIFSCSIANSSLISGDRKEKQEAKGNITKKKKWFVSLTIAASCVCIYRLINTCRDWQRRNPSFFRRNGDFLKKSCPRDLPFLLLLLLLSKINARPGWLASRWMKEFLSHLVVESCFPVYSFKKRNGHVEAFSQLASLAKYRPFS